MKPTVIKPIEIDKTTIAIIIDRVPTEEEMRQLECVWAGQKDHPKCGWCRQCHRPRFLHVQGCEHPVDQIWKGVP